MYCGPLYNLTGNCTIRKSSTDWEELKTIAENIWNDFNSETPQGL